MPGGKYTIAGVVVLESQPSPQRLPAVIAALIATVSSVVPAHFGVSIIRKRLKRKRGGRSGGGGALESALTISSCAKVLDITENLVRRVVAECYGTLTFDVRYPV